MPYDIISTNSWLETGNALRIATGCTRLSALVITRYSCYVLLLYITGGIVATQSTTKAKISGADMGFYYVTNGNGCDIYVTTPTNTDCVAIPFWNLPKGTFEKSTVNALPSGAIAF